jgi:hypothetical protein
MPLVFLPWESSKSLFRPTIRANLSLKNAVAANFRRNLGPLKEPCVCAPHAVLDAAARNAAPFGAAGVYKNSLRNNL